MKIILAPINAKYIHSSYAALSLQAYCNDSDMKICEFTINQNERFIMDEIFRESPDMIAFSCYIWNIGIIRRLIPELRKILPTTIFIAGGPEVSYNSSELLGKPYFDLIVSGEGEAAFKTIVAEFRENKKIQQGIIKGQPLALESIPFVYDADTLNLYENKILYYESSRGCPFNCGYCLSAAEKTNPRVRLLSRERIQTDLDFFLAARIRQVKFIDRTFNCNKDHAMFIWRHLIAGDNGVTNFHFEITGALLDEDSFALLSTARPGLFQFEIGVQSANPLTLQEISRNPELDGLFENIRRLREPGNIHLHLDLIAGLPLEDFQSFGQSFSKVYALRPHQLQLGFLKLLKGSALREQADLYAMQFMNEAPYEILQSDTISYGELSRLKDIEEMTELYYNSGRFEVTLSYLASFFPGGFQLYEALALHWRRMNYYSVSHNKIAPYKILMDFSKEYLPQESIRIADLIKFDLLRHNEANCLPQWLAFPFPDGERKKIRAAVIKRHGSFVRNMLVEKFNYDVADFARNCATRSAPTPRENHLLFNASFPGSFEEI